MIPAIVYKSIKFATSIKVALFYLQGRSDYDKLIEVVKSVESSSNCKALEILIEALVETKQRPLALRVDKKLATRYIVSLILTLSAPYSLVMSEQ